MNALIKKEIRLLLSAWIAAMLLATFPIWIESIWTPLAGEIQYAAFLFPLGILFLGIASFGQELSFGTFPVLFSQPIERRRIWRIKTFTLAIALFFVWLVAAISWKIYFFRWPASTHSFWPGLGFLALFIIVFASGGLWTTLLLRQMTGAFWFTLLVPLAIIVFLGELSEHFDPAGKFYNSALIFTLVIYSIAGFFFARHLFLNAQDTQWTGGEISFPWRGKISERAIVSSRPRHWFSALIGKEIQLHQANILIAVIVLILHLASVVIRKFHPNFESPDVKFILEAVWALWLLMPLLIGSAAVAEERRLGIIESQLCLPVSRRTQLFIKFFVALILSLILGAVMPVLIEGPKYFTDHPQDFIFVFWIPAAAIFFISFYASTLSRTTLQAIGITLGLSAGIYLFMFGIGLQSRREEILNPYYAYVVIILTSSILALVLAWLTFGNFKRLHENWKLWQRNFITIVLALVFGVTLANGIYFRAWEFLTPIEPPHGVARLADSTEVKLAATQNTLFATLPGGRLWVEPLSFNREFNRSGHFEKLARLKSQFIGGSNWVAVTADNFQAVGIQSNGSLWNLQKKSFEKQPDFKLTQIGSETNWSQAAGGRLGFLLLKKDGSLWIWETNSYSVVRREASTAIPAKLKLDLVTLPVRIGEETNWTKVFVSDLSDQRTAYAGKNNAGVLKLSAEWRANTETAHLQSTNIDTEWKSLESFAWMSIGIKINGELWFFWNKWTHEKYVPDGKIQLGKNAKWKSAEFAGYDSMITIRSDGTLWKWPWFYRIQNNPDSVKPIQLGTHSDWITLWHTFALAADGSLWVWDEPTKYAWLAPSRKPVFVGNIFESTAAK